MDLILAYGAGLLTLIDPCILPVLPIVLAAALQADRLAPVAMAGGMSLSFVALGLGVTAAVPALGLDPDGVARGAVLLLPALGDRMELALSGVAARADARMGDRSTSGWPAQLAGGALLGAVWSPCIGPTLGATISLAARGQALGRSGAVMAAFAGGVSTPILALAYGTRAALQRRQAAMRG